MHQSLTCLAVSAVLLTLSAPRTGAITIAKDGQPTATIVIAEKAFQAKRYPRTLWAVGTPAEKMRSAAEDLQYYVEKISGAKLPIVADTNEVKGAVILVGESAKTKPLHLKIPDGVTKDFQEEGYVIDCRGNTLVLAGNNAEAYHGTEYAVFEFLHRLGARWYMPTEYGEYLPALKTITFANVAFRDRPDFRQRLWWQNGKPEMQAADAEFKIRNKMDMGPVLPGAGDATLRQWLPDPGLTNSHPEYFGRNLDGTINPYMANLTNPDLPALVADKMKADIKKQIEKGIAIPSVAIAPDDGMPMDFNPKTIAGNAGFTDLAGRLNVPTEVSVTEEWFRFVNRVAELVARDYPQALIGSNGYANRNQPPEGITLAPNLAIEFAAIWADNIHPMNSPLSWQANVKADIMRRWCQMNSRVYLYDYDYQMLVSALTPIPGVRKLAVGMPLMKKWGLAGFLDEAVNSYIEEGIQTKYLRARMMWNAELNVPQVLDDYYQHWYGAAAAPARAFWDALEDVMEKTPVLGHEDRVLPFVYTPELLATLEKDVAQAEKLAGDGRSRTHVHADRLILKHLQEYLAMHAAEFAGKYDEAARQADLMLADVRELTKLSQFYCVPEEEGALAAAVYYWGVTPRRDFYRKLHEMTDGQTGKLVAMAPREVKFSLDPREMGRFEEWFGPQYNRREWPAIDTCKPFYLQVPGGLDSRGFPYQGYMWYAFELPVPGSARGKEIKLYSPVVEDDAWVWVNGAYVGRRGHLEPYTRPAPLEFDVTREIQPGKTNLIAVRVSTGFCPAAAADGFVGRLFLYTPVKK